MQCDQPYKRQGVPPSGKGLAMLYAVPQIEFIKITKDFISTVLAQHVAHKFYLLARLMHFGSCSTCQRSLCAC